MQDNYKRNEIFKLCEGILPLDLINSALDSIWFNDKAHNYDHILDVVKNTNDIIKYIEMDNKVSITPTIKAIAISAALFHDIGCRYDRGSHETIAYGLVFQMMIPYQHILNALYGERFVKSVAITCLEHRASGKTSYPVHDSGMPLINIDIIRVADRGKFDDYDGILYRFIITNLDAFKLNIDAASDNIASRISDKFGSKGYSWNTYPQLGLMLYGKQIEELKLKIDNHSKVKEDLIHIYNSTETW